MDPFEPAVRRDQVPIPGNHRSPRPDLELVRGRDPSNCLEVGLALIGASVAEVVHHHRPVERGGDVWQLEQRIDRARQVKAVAAIRIEQRMSPELITRSEQRVSRVVENDHGVSQRRRRGQPTA